MRTQSSFVLLVAAVVCLAAAAISLSADLTARFHPYALLAAGVAIIAVGLAMWRDGT